MFKQIQIIFSNINNENYPSPKFLFLSSDLSCIYSRLRLHTLSTLATAYFAVLGHPLDIFLAFTPRCPVTTFGMVILTWY